MSWIAPSSDGGPLGHRPSDAYGAIAKRSGQRSLALRAVIFAGVLFGTIVLFVLSAVAGVLLHLGTPRARRAAVNEVNAILAPSFQGKIRIERVERLGWFGLSGANVTIDDPTGRPVLVVRGVRVRLATFGVIRSALFETREPLTIDLSSVSIDAVDVLLDTDPDGNLDLLNAFVPSKPSSPSDPNARGLRLEVPRITLTHAWAHGQMAGVPVLYIDLDGVRGGLTYAPDVLEAALADAKTAVHRTANGSDVVGSLAAHVKKPSDAKVQPDGRLTWQGTVAGIAESIRASLSDGQVDAVLDAPAIAPDDVRTLLPTSSLQGPANAHAEAHGKLPDLAFGLHAGLGDAAFDARGTALLGDEKKIQVSLHAHDVDAHPFATSVPRSSLGFDGQASAEMKADGALTGEATIAFLGGHVGANTVPTASLHATASRSGAKDLRGNAELVIDEPGAPSRLVVHLQPRGASSAVDFDLSSAVADFDRVPQLNHSVRGSANLDLRGGLDLGKMTLDAELHAKAQGVTEGPNRLESAVLDAHAHGAVVSPRIDVGLRAQGVDAAGVHLVSADVGATGLTTRAHVVVSTRGPDTPDLDASGDVGLGSSLSLGGLRVVLARAGERALVTVAHVTVAGGDVRVDDARIEGLGEPTTATVALAPGTLRLRAKTTGIDLGRVGRLAHVEKRLEAGTLAFDTDMNLRRDGAQGQAMVDLSRAVAGGVKDVSAHVDVTLEGREVVGKVHGQAAGIGTIDLDAKKVELGGGGPLSAASWRQAWGSLDVAGHADLGRVTALLPPEDLPVSEAGGDVTLQVHVERDDLGDMTPDLTLWVNTNRLVIAPKTPIAREIDGVMVYPPPPWRLAGVDFVIDAQIDGERGTVQLRTQAHDVKGDLAHLSVTMPNFPFADIFQHTRDLAADLRTTPLDLKMDVPERGLGGVPDLLKQRFVSGKLTANLTATGTMKTPKIDLAASVRESTFSGNTSRLPLDLDFAAHYDGLRGQASAKARSGDQEMLDAEAQLDAAVDAFLDATGAPPPWKASARVHLAGFPVESIAAIDDKLVSGKISGDASVTDLHENARAQAAFSVDGLRVGSTAYKSAKVDAKADGKIVDASVRIDQADGFVETKAHAVASWGAALAPTLDPKEALGVALSSKNFRIAAFLPFLESTLDELDGRLDAETRIELDPSSRGAHVSGALALRRGTIEAVAGGGEIHDLSASLKFSPDGTITLEKLSGAGMSGRFEGNGSARVDGTAPRSAKAVIVIPSHSPIPLSTGGSEIGTIDGRFEIAENATDAGAGVNLKVNVPQLRVAVHEGSSTSAQALGVPANVRIGAHRGNPVSFVVLPLDPGKKVDAPASKASTVLTIDTNLADVEVVRGTDLKVDLTGRVNVKSAQKTEVTGQIHLKPGGMLSVKGKNFTVESGTVTFVGEDPSNPEIVVKAGWTAPDGTTVYANFVGPLKTGKVTLTSEPTLPQQEIVELLLFGTADGQQAQTPSGSTATTAVGTVGGEAAQPLNHALGQLGLGAVTANVDTTDSANPKPEVEVQIARDLSIQLAVVLGQPLPGVNPDRTLLTLDWRFVTKWTLSSTLGDAGTTIFDLLWQRRY